MIRERQVQRTNLTNLLHKIHNDWASSNTSWPDDHSIWYGLVLTSCSFFSRDFTISYFNNHWPCFQINAISLELLFSKGSNSFVKPARWKQVKSLDKITLPNNCPLCGTKKDTNQKKNDDNTSHHSNIVNQSPTLCSIRFSKVLGSLKTSYTLVLSPADGISCIIF